MTYHVPAMPIQTPIWSGLRLGDQCLIRVFSPGGLLATIDIVPFPGLAVTLEAPPQGASYIVRNDGAIERVFPEVGPSVGKDVQ